MIWFLKIVSTGFIRTVSKLHVYILCCLNVPRILVCVREFANKVKHRICSYECVLNRKFLLCKYDIFTVGCSAIPLLFTGFPKRGIVLKSSTYPARRGRWMQEMGQSPAAENTSTNINNLFWFVFTTSKSISASNQNKIILWKPPMVQIEQHWFGWEGASVHIGIA